MDGSAAWEFSDFEEEGERHDSEEEGKRHAGLGAGRRRGCRIFPTVLRALRDRQLAAARPGGSTPPGPDAPPGGRILALDAVEGGMPCGRPGADSLRPGLGGEGPLGPPAAGASAPAFVQYLNAATVAGPLCYQVLALGTSGGDDEFVENYNQAALTSVADAYNCDHWASCSIKSQAEQLGYSENMSSRTRSFWQV